MLVLTPGKCRWRLVEWRSVEDIGTNQLAAAPLNLVQFPSNDTISLSTTTGFRGSHNALRGYKAGLCLNA